MNSGSKVHSAQSSALQDHPSAVLVPSLSISKHQKLSKAGGSSLPPVTPVVDGSERPSSEEKIGRWSEAEHKIFLEGLATHGKQWKTISTMIGTRTVVQVRTHAQKYFQKLERKNKNAQGGNATKPSIAHTKQSKRKSLPSSMPSRKKAKSLASKNVVSRTASLSHVNHLSLPQPAAEMHAYVSTSSLSSGNWSTDSPTGVNELDLQLSLSEDKEADLLIAETLAVPLEEHEQSSAPAAEDPLDWLIDGGMGHLPESSLGHPPMFPDFSDLSSDTHVLDQAKPVVVGEQPKPAFDSTMLHDIPDPKVTVQSLFLDEGDEHLLE